jgi:phage terminase large subunit-like protein
VEICCTDNNQTATAEVLEFNPEKSLSCSVNRQVKVVLKYESDKNQYVGRVGSLEFVSKGPTSYITKEGR